MDWWFSIVNYKVTKKRVFEGLLIWSSIKRFCNIMKCMYVEWLFFKEFDARKMRPIRCMVDFTGFVQDIACFGPAQTWTVCPVLLNGFLPSGRWRGLPLPPWTVCPVLLNEFLASGRWRGLPLPPPGGPRPRPRPVAPAPAPRTALRWGPRANYNVSALAVHWFYLAYWLRNLSRLSFPVT